MERSSQGRGAEARAKAMRLLEFADKCDKGDEGERQTAQLLEALPPPWVVLHNVFLPGRRFNVDHLLIGPGGVIALDSKNYSGRVTVKDGTMRSGGYRRDDELAAAREHADCVGKILGVEVTPVLCIHTAQLPHDHFVVDSIDVLSPSRLVEWLRGRPALLLDMQVSVLAAASQQKLDVRGLPEPSVDDSAIETSPEPSFGSPTAEPSFGGPTEAWPSVAPTAARPSRTRRQPQKQTARSRRREKLVVKALTGLAVLGFAAWFVPKAAQSVQHRATTSTTVTPASGAAGPPTLRAGTFSCRARGSGWTYTLPSPTDQPTSAAYQVQWAQAPEGPWSTPTVWQTGTPLSINGLLPSGHVFVRAQPVGAGPGGAESMAMEKTPAGSC
jgi:hypothetical protein